MERDNGHISGAEGDGTVSRNMEKMVSGTCPWAENLKKKEEGFGTRIKLFKAFCSSMYGCELWSLNDSRTINEFCVAWRKALRHVINVPYSWLLYTATVRHPSYL